MQHRVVGLIGGGGRSRVGMLERLSARKTRRGDGVRGGRGSGGGTDRRLRTGARQDCHFGGGGGRKGDDAMSQRREGTGAGGRTITWGRQADSGEEAERRKLEGLARCGSRTGGFEVHFIYFRDGRKPGKAVAG